MGTRCLGVWLGHPAPGVLLMGGERVAALLARYLDQSGLGDGVPCPGSTAPSVLTVLTFGVGEACCMADLNDTLPIYLTSLVRFN
jgi:hypothetical protein